MDSQRTEPRGISALTVITVLVVFGLGVTAVFYRWKARDVIAERRAQIAAAPTEKLPRLERWIELNGLNVVLRLEQLRVSARRPWLVSHEVLFEDPERPSEIWGIDLSDLEPAWLVRDELRAVVDLPPARLLGNGPLPPDKALFVPKVRPGAGPIDAAASALRSQYVAEHALNALGEALPQDIPGTAFVVRVGGERRDTSQLHGPDPKHRQ